MLGLLAISSANIVDGYFVGNHVGSIGLASINISYPIFSILFGIALMFASGSSVSVSKLLGEKNIDDAINIFNKAIIAILVVSILLCSSIYLSLDILLDALIDDVTLKDVSREYISIIVIFFPFLMVGVVLDFLVRADENPNLSFVALLVSALVNIVLDYILIVVYDYGIVGAAYATGISQLMIVVMLLPHFLLKKGTLRLLIPYGNWSEVVYTIKNGLSEFVNESSAGITVLIFNFMMIKYLGSDGVAGYTIVTYIIMITVMISVSISEGVQPLIAKNYGADNHNRVNIFVRLAMVTIAILSSLVVLFVYLFPEYLVSIFLDDNSLKTQGITLEFLSYTWIAFLFIGINILITSYLTSIHKPYASATISISRSLILPIGSIWLLSSIYGVVGIYLSLVVSEILTFCIALYFFRANYLR
jgi:putative MATE family efflux protein